MSTDVLVLLAVLGLGLGSMPVYALSAARKAGDPDDVADRGAFVLGGFVRSWFYWFIRPIQLGSIAVGLSPTAFNVIGVVFGIAAGACFGLGYVNLGGWAVLLGGTADVLDGRIARARGMADERGAFLDSTLDRFAEVGAFVGLAVLLRESSLALILAVTALGGSLLVSYARAKGESLGVVCKLGVMQRAERLLLVGFGGILDQASSEWAGWAPGTLLTAIVGLVAVGTVGTAVFRTVWIARRLS